jgi:hypothetical protein
LLEEKSLKQLQAMLHSGAVEQQLEETIQSPTPDGEIFDERKLGG